MRREHLVPLSRQAVEVLRELYPLTGNGRYVFPNARTASRPLSENAVLAALINRRLGYTREEMTAHGFRTLASTLLNELGWPPDAIERQLAHAEHDEVRGACTPKTGANSLISGLGDFGHGVYADRT